MTSGAMKFSELMPIHSWTGGLVQVARVFPIAWRTKYVRNAIPSAFITGEGYRMLFRMLKHGKVEVEVEITNLFSDKPVEVYNTVAEIKGSENPDEVVIFGRAFGFVGPRHGIDG